MDSRLRGKDNSIQNNISEKHQIIVCLSRVGGNPRQNNIDLREGENYKQ